MTILAWHFVGDTLRDGRPVPPNGEWLVHSGEVEICRAGLHASRHPFDALKYAPRPILCRVECADIIAEDHDKFVCRRRRIIARRDATEGLMYFARMRALTVVHMWDAPDVVLDYLMTGDESIRAAARSAAARSAAARDAAWAAARDAAWAAAWTTARAAARSAAAWAAARSAAAMAVAWAAAWAAAGVDFNKLVSEAFAERIDAEMIPGDGCRNCQMVQRGTAAWSDVSNATEWVDALRAESK